MTNTEQLKKSIAQWLWDNLIASHCEIETGKKLLSRAPYVRFRIFGQQVANIEYSELEGLFKITPQ